MIISEVYAKRNWLEPIHSQGEKSVQILAELPPTTKDIQAIVQKIQVINLRNEILNMQ